MLRRPTARELTATAAVGFVLSLPVLRTWARHLGATEAELDARLPGDDLGPAADLVATRAISIAAAPEEVWPWVAQIGQGRGGFYSYDRLENLFGQNIHSASRVEPQWQHLEPGDQVHLAAQAPLQVAVVEPGHALVLRGAVGVGQTPPPYDFTWAFVVRRGRGGGTRLVIRERYSYRRPAAALLVEPVSMVSFVMTEKMLRGIRDRAEHTPA